MSQLVSPRTAGNELGYAEITSLFSTNQTTAQDVTGLSVTVNVGTRPILIRFFAGRVNNNTAGASGSTGGWSIQIQEGATALGTTNAVVYAANHTFPGVVVFARVAPSAGSHTYKITANTLLTGTIAIQAAATQPAFIQVVEV